MALGNTAQSNMLKLWLENVTWASWGDATGIVGSGTAGSSFLGLHTSSPGAGGSQTTNEISYTGYARLGIARAAAQWDITGTSPTQIANHNAITFGTMTAGAGGTVTFACLGRDTSGAGEIGIFGAVANNVVVSLGNPTPTWAVGALAITLT